MHFQAYGKHHVLKWGYDRASALACTAFMSSRLKDPENIRYGCGVVGCGGGSHLCTICFNNSGD